MKVLKFVGVVLLILLIGGIFAQLIGYIDSPIFNWFTEIHLFR